MQWRRPARLLAIDLDLRRLSATAVPGLTATRHDVVHDDIPTGAYDLVHARLLLVHLPERERVLDSLVRSLRPGGWVVIEDFDNMFLDVGSAATPEQAVVRKVALAFKRLLQDRGADLAYARRLPDLLRASGLRDIAGEGRIVFGTGGSAASRLATANYSRVAEDMIGQCICTSGELHPRWTCSRTPASVSRRTADLRLGTPTELNHWARRPSAPTDRAEPHPDSSCRTHPGDFVSCSAPRGKVDRGSEPPMDAQSRQRST